MAAISPPSYEAQLVRRLLEALRAVPDVDADLSRSEVTPVGRDEGYDALIDVRVAGQPLTLFVEAKKTVYPRDVHQTLWRLKSLMSRAGAGNAVAVLAATSLSPGAKDLLRAEGLGYFDSGGSLYVPAPGAFIYVDRPPPKVQASAMRSMFTGRRAQAIHALLVHREQRFGVTQLAELARVSPATASEVLSELEKHEWLETTGLGPHKERRLVDPPALLDAWAAQVIAGPAIPVDRYYLPGLKSDALINRVAEVFEAHESDYAITHEAAAQRYAPFLSAVNQVRCRALAGGPTDDALAELGARPVTEGANFAVIQAKSSGDLLFRERHAHVWLASPVHVYLDLLKSEGRAKEMAEHLRKERIGY